MIAAVIIGVTAFTALIAWMMWRAFRAVERAEKDPRYRRRWFIGLAMFYIVPAVFGIVQVATGKAPIQALVGLPAGLVFIWVFLRAARRVKVPPA